MKQFTVDKLKIDRSFIVDIEENESDRAIVEASVALAHALGLTAIAEGVENEGQKAILMEMGCDEIQGYLFSRPITPEKIPALMGVNPRLSFPRYGEIPSVATPLLDLRAVSSP